MLHYPSFSSALAVARSLLTLMLAAGPFASAQAAFDALAQLQRAGAEVTAGVVDLDSGKTIQTLNADTRLAPASLTKLVIAAAALDSWHTDKTFSTRLSGLGSVSGGRIAGKLILHGDGDPALDHQSLWLLAAQLKAAGIKSVSGGLEVNLWPVGPVACGTQDRCEAFEKSATAYNAPIATLGVDYGTWCVDVRPARSAGKPALVTGCGVAELPVKVEGTINTTASGGKQDFYLDRFTNEEGDVLRVGGNIPAGKAQRLYRAMSNPAYGTGLLMRQVLDEIGIDVDGPVSVVNAPVPREAYPLAASEGLSLREQLGRMLRFSNNYIADVLTLDLATETRRQPPQQLADAAGVLSAFVDHANRKHGDAVEPPPLFSGSGLTPENRLSANDLLSVLAGQYRDTVRFPAYYGSLVVPRQAPFRFLRMGSPAWMDRVALKTGTMNEPRSVCGIAGYMRKREGGWMAFAIIVNGGARMKHVPLYKSMEAARKDLDEVLARY